MLNRRSGEIAPGWSSPLTNTVSLLMELGFTLQLGCRWAVTHERYSLVSSISGASWYSSKKLLAPTLMSNVAFVSEIGSKFCQCESSNRAMLIYILPSLLTYCLYASKYDFLSPMSIKPLSILNPLTVLLLCSSAFLTASSIPNDPDLGIIFKNCGSIM